MSEKDFTHIPGWQLDKGRKRENNEDNLRAFKVKPTDSDDNRSAGVYVVADGVGGGEGGEVASELAVETVIKELQDKLNVEADGPEILNMLYKAAVKANEAILDRKKAHEVIGDTTMVMATVIDHWVYIANIGDSRAYILRENNLRQITNDQTVAQKFVEAGVLTEEEAETHPMSHVLIQSVGNEEDPNIKPDMFTESVEAGDFLLLCTDGLYNYAKKDEIIKIIKNARNPNDASNQLIQAANRAGGGDNIAVIVIEIRHRG